MASGYKDWSAGETLTAADLEDYTVLQSIMRFADATTGNTALSSVLTEGLRRYLLDTNCEQTYSGSAWSSTGPLHGAGLAWTTTLTQSGTVTHTVNHAVYSRLGRRIFANCFLTVTGSGTTANKITLTLPVQAAGTTGTVVGSGTVYDSSAPADFPAIVRLASATTVEFMSTGTAGPLIGATAPAAFGLASSDQVSVFVSYDASADA